MGNGPSASSKMICALKNAFKFYREQTCGILVNNARKTLIKGKMKNKKGIQR